MSEQTHIPPAQVYDFLMSKIEPELTTAMLPLLAEKYKDETQEQKQERGARYEAAFAAYDIALQQYVEHLKQEAKTFQRTFRTATEEAMRGHESDALTTIESQISTDLV